MKNVLDGQNIKDFLIDIIWLTISSLLSAFAVNWIFTFTGLAPGGITGMAIIISSITNAPVSIISLCISIPLLILSFLILGNLFGIKTIYVILMNSLTMAIVPEINILSNINNLLLCLLIGAILGGVLVGLAVGIALKHHGATGGTDVMGLLINHYFKRFKVANIILVLDGIVIILSGVISKEIYIAIFSMLSLLIINRVINLFASR